MQSLEPLLSASSAVVGPLWAALILRAIWLLPDWIAKWRRAAAEQGPAGAGTDQTAAGCGCRGSLEPPTETLTGARSP